MDSWPVQIMQLVSDIVGLHIAYCMTLRELKTYHVLVHISLFLQVIGDGACNGEKACEQDEMNDGRCKYIHTFLYI